MVKVCADNNCLILQNRVRTLQYSYNVAPLSVREMRCTHFDGHHLACIERCRFQGGIYPADHVPVIVSSPGKNVPDNCVTDMNVDKVFIIIVVRIGNRAVVVDHPCCSVLNGIGDLVLVKRILIPGLELLFAGGRVYRRFALHKNYLSLHIDSPVIIIIQLRGGDTIPGIDNLAGHFAVSRS